MDFYTQETILFEDKQRQDDKIDIVMRAIKASLSEKGYDPVNQIVGYIMSGDPSYITSNNDARNLIQTIERDDLIKKLVGRYLNQL